MNKKIVNQLVLRGKLTISERIWIKSLKEFYKSFTKNHKKFINKALIDIAPLIKIKQLKQKKKRFLLKEFPYIIKDKSRITIALKFFLNETNKKKGAKTHKKLINELSLVTKNLGTNLSKKKSLYEHAFMKKKYFYYRWF